MDMAGHPAYYQYWSKKDPGTDNHTSLVDENNHFAFETTRSDNEAAHTPCTDTGGEANPQHCECKEE